jgi:hypothetical protein
MTSIYDAHPLNTGTSTNIRIVSVLRTSAANPDATISCRMKVVSLKDGPTFRALSYVWGDEDVTKTILIDGQPFTVRENLWNFLKQYQSPKRRAYIWIDALCIDQSSDLEKNHQVAMMGQIYSTSLEVVAWLGVDFEKPLMTLSESEALSCFAEFDLIGTCDYWSRLWIVQEFLLGRSVKAWSGAARIDREILVGYAYTIFQERANNKEELNPTDSPILNIFRLGINRSQAYSHIIARDRRDWAFCSEAVFFLFQQAKCYDPRDRIYGLLGMIDEVEMKDYPIYPDYSKSRSVLFVELWVRWCRMRGTPRGRKLTTPRDYVDQLRIILELEKDDKNFLRASAMIADVERWVMCRRGEENGDKKGKREKLEESREIRKEWDRQIVKLQRRDANGRWIREKKGESKNKGDAEERVIKRKVCRRGAKTQNRDDHSMRWTRSRTRNNRGAHPAQGSLPSDHES